MSSSNDNNKTWAASLLRSDQSLEAENQPPGKWEKTATALGAAGSFAAGAAIEQGFTGTQEFVSRFFGLPEGNHGLGSAERQSEPAQEQDKDRDLGRDR